jgi:hypothetical protein
MDDHQRTISSGGARQGIVDSRAVIQHMMAAYPPLFFSATENGINFYFLGISYFKLHREN